MAEDVIADFKQLIVTIISQEITGLRNDLNEKFAQVDQRFDRMEQRFDDVDTKLETIADAHAETLADHGQRLTHLESRVAA